MQQDGVSKKCCVSELLEASSSFSAPIIVRLWLLTARKPDVQVNKILFKINKKYSPGDLHSSGPVK